MSVDVPSSVQHAKYANQSEMTIYILSSFPPRRGKTSVELQASVNTDVAKIPEQV